MGRKRIKPVKKDAAYSPEPRPKAICPECWSRPSVDKRYLEASKSRSRGWGAVYDTEVINGEELQVGTMHYPCSNSDCLTIVVVKTLFDRVDPPPLWVRKGILKGEDADKYLNGHTMAGIWVDTPAPAFVPRQSFIGKKRSRAVTMQEPAKPTPTPARGAEPSVPTPKGRERKESAPARKHPISQVREPEKKPRKQRSDKGKPRGPRKQKAEPVQPSVPKKRGRPKGSKNKKK